MQLDTVDKKLLNLIQAAVPVVKRPFAVLGEKLDGVSETEVMQRIEALKSRNIIRQISAIFDTRSLGYASSLVALKSDPTRVDDIAGIISAHPGVSHNYQRNHAFNLWYTIAVAPTSKLGLESTVQILHETSGATATRLMPTGHLFKIGVELDVEGAATAAAKRPGAYSERNRSPGEAPLTDLEIRFVREMQWDLPTEPEPFVAIASRLGIGLEELIRLTAAMTENGRMRRFSAVLRHREVGFVANGMGVWAVAGNDDDIMKIGNQMAAFRAVTHCYLRPTYPDWPYNIFTMIHARSNAECADVIDQIASETGVTEHDILYSTREFKKTRVQYFTNAEAEWEAKFSS